ncbi:MAG: hypothetical protein LBT37_02065 [Lactobacillaceae bacterium]|jgi:multidrug/hemolysin transport system permease protein|nr:hypothetical protein [Lactobacillaceae bacterium]
MEEQIKIMSNFIKRNLNIYRQDKIGLFFSLLGAFIGLIIYVFFLRNALISGIPQFINREAFLDLWMIGGLIAIVALTSSVAGFSQYVQDLQNDSLIDFEINGTLGNLAQIGYMITAFVESFLTTTIFTFICIIYIRLQVSIDLESTIILKIMGINIISCLFGVCFSSLFFRILKTTSSFASISAIVGTLSGFMSGSYILISSLPKTFATFINYWPGFGTASLYRQLLLKNLNNIGNNNIFNVIYNKYGVTQSLFGKNPSFDITTGYVFIISVLLGLFNLTFNYVFKDRK